MTEARFLRPHRNGKVYLRLYPLLFITAMLPGSTAFAVPSINGIKTEDRFKTYSTLRILYPHGVGESALPSCEPWSVCSRLDTYSRPWVERLCTCPNGQACPSSLRTDDGHTVVDRSRQYKVCESVESLPRCRFFRDITWTYITRPDNISQQIIHCKCPENSTPYITRHDFETHYDEGTSYKYYFACSPQSTLRCRRKEPCRLFTVNKRYPIEEVTSSIICQCPPKTFCPKRHTESFVVEDSDSKKNSYGSIRSYSAYCNPMVS